MHNWLYKSFILCLLITSLQIKSNEFLIYRGLKGPGLGAQLCSVLGLLYHYDLKKIAGVSIEFNKDSLYYDASKGPNWWEYYFSPTSLGDHLAPKRVISKSESAKFGSLILCRLPIYKCNQLVKKYIKIKPHIAEKVHKFSQENLSHKFVIGVHYRGTDKKIEVKRVDYEKVSLTVNLIIKRKNLKNYVLFVASDEQAFIEYIKTKFSNVVYTNAHRSLDGKPLHYTLVDGQRKEQDNAYSIGEECVVDYSAPLCQDQFL